MYVDMSDSHRITGLGITSSSSLSNAQAGTPVPRTKVAVHCRSSSTPKIFSFTGVSVGQVAFLSFLFNFFTISTRDLKAGFKNPVK